ncbi:hypothetical protein MCOL2_05368 [Listeria fleischmannii FSL S10-1203]|uniref:Major facilitator superfamily (MFS) profile domain-containing protein n=1 Tax=Listeria fleischmannii FSL S10-1203 TaxID=1265822 RepID=W7DGX7_9LIST|nr:hypothetical protein MCOL2_05368 [Listeria fleischmannii FSL S10-1203]
MVNIAISFFAGLYGGHLADIFGRRRLMLIGECIIMFSYLGLVLVNSPFFYLTSSDFYLFISY